jgi:hypothetical protein
VAAIAVDGCIRRLDGAVDGAVRAHDREAEKYVVSSTLERVDWNAQLVRGDLATAVRELKRQSGRGIATGGVTLPFALAELG